MTTGNSVEHSIGGSVDTQLRWHEGWDHAQLDAGCGTGSLDLGVLELRALANTANYIADQLAEAHAATREEKP